MSSIGEVTLNDGASIVDTEVVEPRSRKRKPNSNMKACDSCRSRKAKCDMSLPSCHQCEKKGIECNYSTRERPGLRPGFGKGLEERLQRIEVVLQEVRDLVEPNASANAAAQRFYDPPLLEAPTVSPRQPESTMGGADKFLDVSPLGLEGPGEGSHQPNFDMPEGLPPRHVLHRLSSLYFECCHPWINIFSRPDIEADISSLPNNHLLSLHAITVCGFKYWTDEDPSLQDRDMYIENSRQRLLAAAIDQVSVPCAQALLVLTVDAMGASPSTRTLNMMSLLSTAISALDLPQGLQDEWADRRSRILRMINNTAPGCEEGQTPKHNIWSASTMFWAIYVFDRIIGVSHGIPCKIAPNLFSRKILTDEETSMPSSRIKALITDVSHGTAKAVLSESWQKMIEMATLIERVNEFLLKSFNLAKSDHCKEWKNHFRVLDAALCSWRDLRITSSFTSQVFDPVEATVHAMYHAAVIRLHSVAAFPPRDSLITSSPLAFGRCQQAVQCMRDICQCLLTNDISKLGPLFVFCVWVASRNAITLWTSGWEEQEWVVPSELTVLRDSLRALALYWPCADTFSGLIDMVIDTSQKTVQPSMLAVFNDVSNTAYGLHNVLGEKLQNNRDIQTALMWDWISMLGMPESNSLILQN